MRSKANFPLVLELSLLIRCYMQYYLEAIKKMHQNEELLVPKIKHRNQTENTTYFYFLYEKIK